MTSITTSKLIASRVSDDFYWRVKAAAIKEGVYKLADFHIKAVADFIKLWDSLTEKEVQKIIKRGRKERRELSRFSSIEDVLKETKETKETSVE